MADSTDNSNSIVGGLMGLRDPDLLLHVGLGLMSAAKYGGNVGDGLSQALGNWQQQKLRGQQYQMGQMDLMRQKMLMGADQLEFGGQGPQPPAAPGGLPGSPAQPQAGPAAPGMPGAVGMPGPGMPQGGLFGAAPPVSAAPGGLLGGAQPPQPQAAQPGAPSWLTPPSQEDIYNSPVPGFPSPGYIRGTALLQGRNPLPELTSMREQQLKSKQQLFAPAMGRMDTLIKSDKPTQYMQADPEFRAAWPTLAQHLGIDPVSGLNDQNVRTAFTFGRNNLASALSLGIEAPPVPLQTTRGPLGSIYQTEPVSGKTTQVKGEEDLKQVIGPQGQPVNLRASAAEGKTPFNPTLFGAASMTDQAVQFAADTYRTTGKMPAAMGRNPAMQAKILDKVASDAAQSGDTAGAIAARTASLKANGQALDQTTKLESATISYYNTLDKNLTKLQELAGKIDGTGSPVINRVYRAWQQGASGDPTVSQYVAYLNSVQSEFAKINSGSLGNAPVSDAARKHADDTINKFMSQGQINALAEAMRGEGANRLSAIREQKQSLVGSIGGSGPRATAAPATSPPAAPKTPKTLTYDPATGTFK